MHASNMDAPQVCSLVDTGPARLPSHSSFTGRLVCIEPLSPSHIEGLYDSVGRPEHAALWSYIPNGPFREKTAFEDFITARAASRDPFFYTVLDRAHGKPLGFYSLMRIDTAQRVVEIGNIVFSPALQRTTSATEAFCLIARAVFEDLGFRRFEWKCDGANAPSRRAAERFGFSYEGLFRQHMIVKGRNRDTAWFSIIDSEWPALRDALEKWLDPRNFDSEGNQRRSLGSFRG